MGEGEGGREGEICGTWSRVVLSRGLLTHMIRIVHTSLPGTYTLYTLYKHCIHTLYTHTVYTVYTHSIYSLHTLYTLYTHKWRASETVRSPHSKAVTPGRSPRYTTSYGGRGYRSRTIHTTEPEAQCVQQSVLQFIALRDAMYCEWIDSNIQLRLAW